MFRRTFTIFTQKITFEWSATIWLLLGHPTRISKRFFYWGIQRLVPIIRRVFLNFFSSVFLGFLGFFGTFLSDLRLVADYKYFPHVQSPPLFNEGITKWHIILWHKKSFIEMKIGPIRKRVFPHWGRKSFHWGRKSFYYKEVRIRFCWATFPQGITMSSGNGRVQSA